MTRPTSRIVPAGSSEALVCAAALFREYAASLQLDLSFQDFESELATLPGGYAPPSGRLFLAILAEPVPGTSALTQLPDCTIAAGCVALRRSEDEICEMKRLYVRPKARGLGVGRNLALTVISAAHEIGYRRMRLDTLPQMEQAQTLYRTLGFREIPPYRYNPVPGTRYFELTL